LSVRRNGLFLSTIRKKWKFSKIEYLI
jgi:hypothetical protein